MIRFVVGFSGDSVGVGCKVVKFRGSIVCALGHDVLLAGSMQTSRQSRWNVFFRWVANL
jgi:hypothetical protein